MINYVLNFLGIVIYFISKYGNRGEKSKKFSFKFWVKDNWPELSSTFLLNIALMIILMMPETQINIDDFIKEYVGFGLHVAVKPFLSFLLGLGLTALFYKKFKTKTKK